MTRSARVSPMLASSNNGSMAPRSAASLTPLLLTAKYSCCAGLEWAFAQANRPRVQAARLASRMFLRFMAREIGRAHVRTPVTNAHLVCRLLLEKKKIKRQEDHTL